MAPRNQRAKYLKDARAYRRAKASIQYSTALFPLSSAASLSIFANDRSPLIVYGVLSLISFIFYGYDKYRASNKGWRVRENTLHLIDFLGGWPGGLLAQRQFKHKTRKTSFQLIFWATVLVHNAAWVYAFNDEPVSAFRKWVDYLDVKPRSSSGRIF